MRRRLVDKKLDPSGRGRQGGARGFARGGLLGLLLLGGVASLTGCRQAQGERCQITSDCEEGLVCELQGNTPAMGGICRGTTTTPTNDLSTGPDLSAAVDMAADLTTGDMADGGADSGG